MLELLSDRPIIDQAAVFVRGAALTERVRPNWTQGVSWEAGFLEPRIQIPHCFDPDDLLKAAAEFRTEFSDLVLISKESRV